MNGQRQCSLCGALLAEVSRGERNQDVSLRVDLSFCGELWAIVCSQSEPKPATIILRSLHLPIATAAPRIEEAPPVDRQLHLRGPDKY